MSPLGGEARAVFDLLFWYQSVGTLLTKDVSNELRPPVLRPTWKVNEPLGRRRTTGSKETATESAQDVKRRWKVTTVSQDCDVAGAKQQ